MGTDHGWILIVEPIVKNVHLFGQCRVPTFDGLHIIYIRLSFWAAIKLGTAEERPKKWQRKQKVAKKAHHPTPPPRVPTLPPPPPPPQGIS